MKKKEDYSKEELKNKDGESSYYETKIKIYLTRL